MDYQRDYMRVKPTGIPLEAGKMLIAAPFFNDYYFNHTVVLLSDYSEKATAGLILNCPTEAKVSDELKEWTHSDRVFFGGPVGLDGIAILHDTPHSGCEQVAEGVFSGASPDFLQMINKQKHPNVRYRFYVGYAGWSKDQLEEEIRQQMWVISDCIPSLIWDTPYDLIWATAVKLLGRNYLHWLDIPEDVHSN